MLLLGVIVGAKGIKGEVKIKSFTEAPEDIAAYGPLQDASGKTTFDIKVVGLSKGLPVVRIAGISDRNAAEALKGTELFCCPGTVARDGRRGRILSCGPDRPVGILQGGNEIRHGAASF